MPVNADEQNALDTFNRAFDLALQSGQIPKRLYDSSRRQSESKDAPIHRGSQAGGLADAQAKAQAQQAAQNQ